MKGLARYITGEWELTSRNGHNGHVDGVQVDVNLRTPDGQQFSVPGFWAGNSTWKVRISGATVGRYEFVTTCSDTTDVGLHGVQRSFEVLAYQGNNPLYQNGPIETVKGKDYFQHADGTPFFWLGDTWWMTLCDRLSWDDFQILCRERARKGFNVVQIIAGLYPDMPPFDPRGKNEAGYPFKEEFSEINPAYFDSMDRRIFYLVENGITPCIVGCWGYFLGFMGKEKVKALWRYLVARYASHPVVWCIAGEATMPYYLSPEMEEFKKNVFNVEYESPLVPDWDDVTGYVQHIDPYRRPTTLHPPLYQSSSQQVKNRDRLDFSMIQGGAGGFLTLADHIRTIERQRQTDPRLPVCMSEAVYEGLACSNYSDIQSVYFWTSVLSGCKAYTYGANGIWQVNIEDCPFGPSPHGGSYGDTPWHVAMKLPGSKVVAIGKSLLENYPWWQFESHPEWVDYNDAPPAIHSSAVSYYRPYAAGVPGQVRFIYLYHFVFLARITKVKNLEAHLRHSAWLIEPDTGKKHELGPIAGNADGSWQVPNIPVFRDWVLLIESHPR